MYIYSVINFNLDSFSSAIFIKKQVAMDPVSNEFDAKQLICRRYNDSSVWKRWPFKANISSHGGDDKPMIVVTFEGDEEKQFAVEEITSMVLTNMRKISEDYYKTSITDMVAFVPANFNESQIQATKNAGGVADLHVMYLVEEPTAFAIDYGLAMKKSAVGAIIDQKNVLVFNLDDYTLDVSVFTIDKEGIFEMKAIAQDTHLGGDDFTNRMVNHFVQEFKKKHNKDMSRNPRVLWRLRIACERANITLLSSAETIIDIDSLYEGVDFYTIITRPTFEELTVDLFGKVMELVRKCLRDAQMDKSSVHDVLFVGGSTMIPKVQQPLLDFFDGMVACKIVSPDEADAHREAVRAAVLRGEYDDKVEELRMMDVTPLSLGVADNEGFTSVMIPRNTPIPSKMESILTSRFDNQTFMIVEVYEGERLRTRDNTFLAVLQFLCIPPSPMGTPKIIVRFDVDANGILNVSAEEMATGQEKMITIRNARERLSKEEIAKIVKDRKKNSAEDKRLKKKFEAKKALEVYTYKIGHCVKQLAEPINYAGNWLFSTQFAVADHPFNDMMVWLQKYCNPIITDMYQVSCDLDMVGYHATSTSATVYRSRD